MSDTLMSIIGIFVAVILMFIFPLVELSGKSDKISQTVVQITVSDFVNTVSTKGKITKFDYENFIQSINATGNSFDVEIEAQILDDNSRRLTTANNENNTVEDKYFSVYTNTILQKLNDEAIGEYQLKRDDYINVTVKNTNITVATQLKNLFYKLIGERTYTIGASAAAIVVNSGIND